MPYPAISLSITVVAGTIFLYTGLTTSQKLARNVVHEILAENEDKAIECLRKGANLDYWVQSISERWHGIPGHDLLELAAGRNLLRVVQCLSSIGFVSKRASALVRTSSLEIVQYLVQKVNMMDSMEDRIRCSTLYLRFIAFQVGIQHDSNPNRLLFENEIAIFQFLVKNGFRLHDGESQSWLQAELMTRVELLSGYPLLGSDEAKRVAWEEIRPLSKLILLTPSCKSQRLS